MISKQRAVRRQLFPEKLWDLVNEPASGIRWSSDGKRIEVERPQFEKFMGTKFRSRNFDSFIRQLHFYGFRKSGNSYHHDKFQRDRPEVLLTMKRKYSHLTLTSLCHKTNVATTTNTNTNTATTTTTTTTTTATAITSPKRLAAYQPAKPPTKSPAKSNGSTKKTPTAMSSPIASTSPPAPHMDGGGGGNGPGSSAGPVKSPGKSFKCPISCYYEIILKLANEMRAAGHAL